MLHQKIKAQANKTTNIKEISAHLCGTMGSNYTHVINEDDDDDEDVCMYPTDMHPNERDAC